MSFDQVFDINEIHDSYIFIFPDLTPLLDEFHLTLEQFRDLSDELHLELNISAKKDLVRDDEITLDSGLTLSFDPETFSLDEMEVLDVYDDESNTIVELDGFPLSPEQRLSIEKYFEQNIVRWVKLPRDVFYELIIKEQGIKGKDLIRFCSSNKQLKAKCDKHDIFARLLKDDFDISVEKGQNAREMYADQYRGKIWTFGDGRYGQLGHDDEIPQSRPKQIIGFNNVKSVACGERHTAMILADGTIWTFGNGSIGRLGHGDEVEQLAPKQIIGFNNVKSVACGERHTAMILADGTIWTFGEGRFGRLGHGDKVEQLAPKQIIGFNNVKSVASGGTHTAMILADGTIWTFGWGIFGQLGHNDEVEQLAPKQIEGFHNVKSVSCGAMHTAMILADGTIWTFGQFGYNGQLGHNDEEPQFAPKQITGFNNVKSVDCGYFHTAMILSDGTIWTFGRGEYGRLGHDDEVAQLAPKQIEGFNNVKSVSCGGEHTAMILSDGTIWTFGLRDEEEQLVPKQIEGFNNVRSVSCGGEHTAMITK